MALNPKLTAFRDKLMKGRDVTLTDGEAFNIILERLVSPMCGLFGGKIYFDDDRDFIFDV